MLSESPNPWPSKELNELTFYDKINCSIRKCLISGTGKIECPSQKEICYEETIYCIFFRGH